MNANEVINAYVHDVVAQLPHAQRRDVALELRALLHESLSERAGDGTGHADAERATELLREMGHPHRVAARYRPPLTVIDPADGLRFARLTWVGLLVIWALGAVDQALRAQAAGHDGMRAVTQWWFAAVMPSFWWPGVLVAAFAGVAWVRRRWPDTEVWRPLDPNRLVGGRAALVLAVVGIVAGLAVLADPRTALALVWGQALSPAVLDAFTYAPPFRQLQGPVVFLLLALNLPLYLAAIAKGRWSPPLRLAGQALSLCTVLALAWTLASGPVFLAPATDQAVQWAMGLTVLATVWTQVRQWRRAQTLAGSPRAA